MVLSSVELLVKVARSRGPHVGSLTLVPRVFILFSRPLPPPLVASLTLALRVLVLVFSRPGLLVGLLVSRPSPRGFWKHSPAVPARALRAPAPGDAGIFQGAARSGISGAPAARLLRARVGA